MLPNNDRLNHLVRPELLNFGAYSARTAAETLEGQVDVPVSEIIKLDANENPYGCSPRVYEMLEDADFSVYPDSDQTELRKLLAEYSGAKPQNIVASNGSNMLIDLICRLFINPGDKVINCTPTFDIYRFSTQVCGGKLHDVPRDNNFNADIAAVKSSIDTSTKLVFIANPNNPTGNLTGETEIEDILNTGVLTVVDEAYYEFCGSTVVPLMKKYNNLMIIRTFSKWAGLAGLRVGYGIFPSDVAEYLHRIKIPYAINVAALKAVEASFQDINHLQETVKAIIDERERLAVRLAKLSLFKVYPSHSNFILCTLIDGNATKLQKFLQDKGIMVRYFSQPRLKNSVRVSVGKPEHSDKLIEILKQYSDRSGDCQPSFQP